MYELLNIFEFVINLILLFKSKFYKKIKFKEIY